MPEFHAVQCCQCDTYQVQQVKKAAKFSCRLCGTKQSVTHVHAISSKASDVRAVVMKLNAKRQAAEEEGGAVDPSSPPPTDDKNVKKEAVSAVAWQDYNEDDEAPERLALADPASKQMYTTEAPEHCSKRRKRDEPGLVSRHIVKGPGRYGSETLRYDDGSIYAHIRQPRMTAIHLGSPEQTPVPREHKQAAPKRLRQPLVPTQPHRAAPESRDKSCPEGCALQASVAGKPDATSAGLGRRNDPAAAKGSTAQRSGSLGGAQQPEDSRADMCQAPDSAFCSSAAVKAAEGAHAAFRMDASAGSPAQPAQLPSGQEAEPGTDAASMAMHGLGEGTGAEGSMWQAFMDDVDELQCDVTPGKQQQQRPHRLRQATGAGAAGLDEASCN